MTRQVSARIPVVALVALGALLRGGVRAEDSTSEGGHELRPGGPQGAVRDGPRPG